MAKCTGMRCPMQYGYKVEECNRTDCPYRTESITNADRIRAMTDEELARQLNKLRDGYPVVCRDLPECDADLDEDRDIPLERCEGCWFAWLRQPAEEG